MMDTNNERQKSKSEYHELLDREFDRLDTTKDGQLTKEELVKLNKQ